MRIIAGSAGRTAIKVPAGVTRPTTDFVRQAIFSILSERVPDARVLDLYAGSGRSGLKPSAGVPPRAASSMKIASAVRSSPRTLKNRA